MLKPLATLVAEVRRVDAQPKFIFVGDYVNRGPDSKGVIDFLLTLENAFFCRGNHDDVFDLVINGDCYADNAAKGNRTAAFQWFVKYGLDSTLLSYGCDHAVIDTLLEHCTIRRLDDLAECVPETHRNFIRRLPAVYEEDDLFVIHGKWDPDELSENPGIAERLEKQPKLRHRTLWGRYTQDDLTRIKAWHRTAFVGHTPVSYYTNPDAVHEEGGVRWLPIVGKNLVLLDTAAALSTDGRLTAYCPDEKKFVQADHFGAPVRD